MTEAFYPLDETAALKYFNTSSLRTKFFGSTETLSCRDLADGNINLVFRISSTSDSSRSIILKQALPYARRYPDFKLPLDRARIEHEVLKVANRYCEGLAPQSYYFDPVLYLNLMEDLNDHVIMRVGLMGQVEYPKFAAHIATYMARTLFYTSDLFLPPDQKKERMAASINPVLCKVTEDLVFTFPYQVHETNRYPAGLEEAVQNLHRNAALQGEVRRAKAQFMSNGEALIHGDLHTGSIMLNQNETRVIDPEFAFYGPMAFDVGNVIGNLLIASASQVFHCSEGASRAAYQRWLKGGVVQVWRNFVREFSELWHTQGRAEWQCATYEKRFLQTLLRDSLSHGACEMVRRTIGMAHVPELDTITDDGDLVQISQVILGMAERLLLYQGDLEIEEVVESVTEGLL